MSTASGPKHYTLEPGDKVTPVTFYLPQAVLQGDLVSREALRISTWLRTPGLPDFAGLYDVTLMRAWSNAEIQVVQFRELHLPIAQIIAMHLTPPATDKIEYDPNEQNRKMEPVSALAGNLRIDGSLRMPGHLSLSKQMGVMREPFTMLYDTTITSGLQPGGMMQTSMTLIRTNAFALAERR